MLESQTQQDLKILESRLIKIVAEKLRIEASGITAKSRLIEDLGASDLDVVELQQDIEANFGITITDEEMEKIHTIGDFAKTIVSSL